MSHGPAPAATTRTRVGLAALAVVLISAGVIAYVLGSGAAMPAELAPPTPAASDRSALPDACEGIRVEACRQVRSEDGRVIRYAVLDASGDSSSRGAAIFDAGGPGIAVFGAHWPAAFDESVRPALPDTPVILIEEPWVTAPMTARCRQALRDWFDQAHRQATVSASLKPCRLGVGEWGWTPESYQAAVDAVEGDSSMPITSMVGASFGAYRTQYIGDQLEWVALANPAPAAMSGTDYLNQRHRAVQTLLLDQCGCSEPELRKILDTLGDRVEGAATERSADVTAADVGAAALALSYLPSDRSEVAAFWEGDVEVIGRLADTVWGRYGTEEISPAYLAYLDEVCAAYTPWPSQERGGDVIATTLGAIHAPCAEVPAHVVGTLPDDVRVCVSGLARDPISPATFRATWNSQASLEEEGDQHANILAASRCVEAVREPA